MRSIITRRFGQVLNHLFWTTRNIAAIKDIKIEVTILDYEDLTLVYNVIFFVPYEIDDAIECISLRYVGDFPHAKTIVEDLKDALKKEMAGRCTFTGEKDTGPGSYYDTKYAKAKHLEFVRDVLKYLSRPRQKAWKKDYEMARYVGD